MANPTTETRKLQIRPEAPLPYRLERRRRRTIAIQISRSGEVRVLAPRQIPVTEVEAFLHRKERWILKKLDEFAQLPPLERPQLRDGARLPYLGGYLRLRLLDGRGPARLADGAGQGGSHRSAARQGAASGPPERSGPKVGRGEAPASQAPQPAPEPVLLIPGGLGKPAASIHRKVNRWYIEETERLVAELASELAPRARELRVPPLKGVGVRRMRRRWGSCLPDGRIILNSELLGAPLECIRYVVGHEICHLREANHSSRFYALMGELIPEWKSLRRRLNQEGPLGFLEEPKEDNQ